MKVNDKFMTAPEQFEKLVKQMVLELNRIGHENTKEDWLALMFEWWTKVKSEYESQCNSKNIIQFTGEELELIALMFKDAKDQNEPSTALLSCMLDHMEIAGDSPKLWATICLEMEQLGGFIRSEDYWKKAFEKWCSKVKRKKKMLDIWDPQNSHRDTKPNILSQLEIRLIEYLSTQSIVIGGDEISSLEIIYANYCRICLLTSSEMVYLFDESSEHSLIEKITFCSFVIPIEKNDGYPQSICMNCAQLVETVFKFKTLCEKTDHELRSLSTVEIFKEEEESNEIFYEVTEEPETEGEPETIYEEIDFPSFDEKDEEEEEEEENVEESMECEAEIEEKPKRQKSSKFKATKKRDKRFSDGYMEEAEEEVEEDGHTAEPSASHQCETCGIICKNTATLKIHIKSHSDVKPHICSFCGKDFKTRLSLKIHIRSHTGERPYVCEVSFFFLLHGKKSCRKYYGYAVNTHSNVLCNKYT